MPPWVLRMRKGLRPASAGFQPMPTFWVRPNRSPLGRSSNISGVSGRRPSGPGALVRTWKIRSSVFSTSAGLLTMKASQKADGWNSQKGPGFAGHTPWMKPRNWCNGRSGQVETKREKNYAIDSEEKCVGGRFGGGFGADGGGVFEHVRPVGRAAG